MSNGSYVRRAGITEVVLVPMLEESENHVERLLAENARLREALVKYGSHSPRCHIFDPCFYYYDPSVDAQVKNLTPRVCNCGYDAALGDAK